MIKDKDSDKQARLKQTFSLWKDFTFEAAHQLHKVPPFHKCGRLHGHSYRIRVHCSGKLDPAKDWVVDYAQIAAVVGPIIQKLDHTNLNDLFDFETTAENLAWWLCTSISQNLPSLYAIEVFETPTTSVTCKK